MVLLQRLVGKRGVPYIQVCRLDHVLFRAQPDHLQETGHFRIVGRAGLDQLPGNHLLHIDGSGGTVDRPV